MALERRGDRLYFYESHRTPDGRVKKTYIGGGVIGHLAAETFAEMKAQKNAIADQRRAFVRQLLDLESQLRKVHKRVDRVAAATLYAAGFYQHRTAWRRRRLCPKKMS